MVSVTVVTYNMGDGPDERKRDDLLQLLDAGAQVICLQEAGDRREVLEDFCAEVGWVLWRGFAAGSPSVPIVHDGQALIEARSSRLALLPSPALMPPLAPGAAGAGMGTTRSRLAFAKISARFRSIGPSYVGGRNDANNSGSTRGRFM